jgi:IS4 transposase
MVTIRKADELAVQLKRKLQSFSINAIAVETRFVKRKPIKIKPLNFLIGLFINILTSDNSLSTFASTLGLLAGCTISKQAVDKRIQLPVITFLESILAKALCCSNVRIKYKKSFRSIFNRIIVQDSSCIQLDAKLSQYFPGNRNQTNNKSAILKIQAFFDLLTEQFCHLSFSPYRKNDQKSSVDILDILLPGDLIIRDLGYFVLPVLNQIGQCSAYFLSRLKCHVCIYPLDGQSKIDLLKQLKKYGTLDYDVLIGAKQKLPARLIAVPVPEQVANERRRRSKRNRDRRLHPSKEHLALLGWNIFITNIEHHQLNVEQIVNLYGCRWRIETIFKSWKSHFKIENVPRASVTRLLCYIYAMLIFITLFQTYIYINLYNKIKDINSNQLSLLRLSKFVKSNIWAIILFFNNNKIVEEQIFYHCLYDKRQNRTNYMQKFAALG